MLEWGDTTKLGFTAVSRAFLRQYVRLGITMDEAMLILHILDFKWNSKDPFPKVETLATLTGRNEASVRKYIRELRNKGFLTTTSHHGRSNVYNFDLLFERLRTLTYEESAAPKPTETTTQGPVASPVPAVRKARIARTLSDVLKEKAAAVPKEFSPKLGVRSTEQPAKNPDSLPIKDYGNRSTKKEEEQVTGAEGGLGVLISELLSNTKERAMGRKPVPRGYKKPSDYFEQADRLSDKQPETYNVRDLEFIFLHAWEKRWDTPPGNFSMKDKGQLKMMIEEFGPAQVAKVIIEVIAKWDTYATRYRLNGRPSVACIFGYRRSWFSDVLDGEVAAKPTWGSHWEEPAKTPDHKNSGGIKSFLDD